ADVVVPLRSEVFTTGAAVADVATADRIRVFLATGALEAAATAGLGASFFAAVAAAAADFLRTDDFFFFLVTLASVVGVPDKSAPASSIANKETIKRRIIE